MPRSLQLSATTLGLFHECPRCCWLHLRGGIRRPSRPFPSITGGIDRLVQAYCDGARPALPELLAGACGVLGVLDGARLATPKIATLSWSPPGGPRLTGRLDDCLVLPDGRHAPLDHKSRGSRPEPGYSAQYYQLQMDVYALLVRENNYETYPEAFLAYYYPHHLDVGGSYVTADSTGRQPAPRLEHGFPFACTVEALPVSPARAIACYLAAVSCLDGPCPRLAPLSPCTYCLWADEVGRA